MHQLKNFRTVAKTRSDQHTALPHFIQQRNHIALSYLVDCPGAPNREHLTMQDAGYFARGSVLGDVAANELSNGVASAPERQLILQASRSAGSPAAAARKPL
jgi:hypothetical protein